MIRLAVFTGMVTSTIHVLVITPVIFYMMKRRALRKGKLAPSDSRRAYDFTRDLSNKLTQKRRRLAEAMATAVLDGELDIAGWLGERQRRVADTRQGQAP